MKTQPVGLFVVLRSYRKELDALQKYIDEGDAQAIERVFENAMRNRRGLVFPGK